MSQPPYYHYYSHQYHQQQPQQQYQQQQHNQYPPQQQFNLMQHHQPTPSPNPYFVQHQQLSHAPQPQKPQHWFDQMCEVITTQQSRHEAGSLDTPPMLTPGNYVQWSSRFIRFLELKKPHGKYLVNAILDGPFDHPTETTPGDPNADPPRAPSTTLVAENLLTDD